jgi:single-strand DNA-binding protein
MSLNKVLLIGHLGNDPEIRSTQSGQSVCNFSLATNRRWRDKNGENKEETEWHRVVVWGRQGENCKEYLKKGRQIFLEGRVQTRQWEDRDGNKRYTTEIIADTVNFLGGGGRGASGGEDFAPSPEAPADFGGGSAKSGDDDIPF